MEKKIALVTGATSGIGKATAEKLAELNFNIIITGRREERLEELKSQLILKNIEVKTLLFDIRNRESVETAFNSLPEEWKKIDVLVNNAGLAAGLDLMQNGNIDDWETMIDTNIKGLLYVSQLVMPYMIAQKKGHIINIGSIAGKETYMKGGVYCGTKHAVDAITKSMRIDLLEHGIKVTQIAPGMVETEFSIVRLKGDTNAAAKVYEGLEPLTANDIADTLIFVITRPPHVNINDIVVMPTAQASATYTYRK